MERLLLECALRAALVAMATAIVLRGLRIRTATMRHKAWTGVLLVMLALPAWMAVAPRLSIGVMPSRAVAAAAIVAPGPSALEGVSLDRTVTSGAVPRAVVSFGVPAMRTFALSVYLFGAAILLIRLAYGTAQALVLRRRAAIEEGRLTSASCATPVTVGWLKPVVILPAGWQRWPETQLNAVLVHEHAHVARRDPLVQWLSLLNISIFWFHPLAWWLRRRLAALAEEACDATVLAAGHSPEDYSTYLIQLARDMMLAGRRVQIVGHAMPGSDLTARIRTILAGSQPPRASTTRMVLAVLLGTSAAAVSAVVTPTTRVSAMSAIQTPIFEVASIRPNDSGSGKMDMHVAPGGRFSATNVTLRQLIADAWELQDFQIIGAPDWIAKDHFDIEAKGPAGSPDNLFTKEKGSGPSPGQLMMRALLADRFNLDARTETRELPLYALVRDRHDGTLGPQLKASTKDCAALDKTERPSTGTPAAVTASRCEILSVPGSIVSGGTTIADLATYLSPLLDRVVLDRTGLAGNFEYTLHWTPETYSAGMNRKAAAMGLAAIDENGPSLPTALREQLGIKLDSQKGPVNVLVIQRVERLIPR